MSPASFFAKLANIEDVARLSDVDREALSSDLASVVPSVVAAIENHASPRTSAEIAGMRSSLLELTHLQARQCILGMLREGKTVLPYPVKVIAKLEGRKAVKTYQGQREEELLFPELLKLFDEDPFPFALCATCSKVFVQHRRGQPRLYCARSCKTKGVPSAAKHAQYVRDSRRRIRNQEIETTKRVCRGWPKAERLAQLMNQFPKKSRRQLLYLLRQAEQKPGRK